jgi:chemotaxis protein methyltransferase CheR
MEDRDYLIFIEKVKRKIGLDLSLYKEAQMKRRLTSLREKRGFTDFQGYFEQIDRDKELLAEFLDRITINVSEFFRNPNRWEYLDMELIPKLLEKNKKPKFWSAACSTGEEPYTLAMILSKHIPISQIDITATDIDENAILKAKQGIYQERAVKDVPEDLLSKYFIQENQLYHIKPEIKKIINFKRHNLLADPFDGPYDMIICRNVMIYFTDEAKEQLYHKFSKALNPGGYFFVGSTEQIFYPQKYQFETESPFFYRRIGC